MKTKTIPALPRSKAVLRKEYRHMLQTLKQYIRQYRKRRFCT